MGSAGKRWFHTQAKSCLHFPSGVPEEKSLGQPMEWHTWKKPSHFFEVNRTRFPEPDLGEDAEGAGGKERVVCLCCAGDGGGRVTEDEEEEEEALEE
jgi:hypothetical protein